MIPALPRDAISLADVLQSCLSATRGAPNRLELAPVDQAVVVLIDGLGVEALRARAGHARLLSAALTPKSIIHSGFPTTTAAAIATLTTGVLPGQHGLVGYSVLDAAHHRVVNQLTGWDDRLDPLTWQRMPTIFERAREVGVSSSAIGPQRFRDSGYTKAVLRGAEYHGAARIIDRMLRAAELAAAGSSALSYVYVPELDIASHAHGWQSSAWIEALEETDAALAGLNAALGQKTGLLVTADHGVLDVETHSHVLIDSVAALVDGVKFVAGDPRCLQLHIESDASPAMRERLLDAWRSSESSRAWVLTRDEAIQAGWFGEVHNEVRPRIGDIVVAARKNIAYYDSRDTASTARSMIGQHGSWSDAETKVPLLRFGAFAR
ncbi:MAG: alkaline phosphatase family protein [Salinibacterium sp.]|nr:alkaline phosphatase family protein [Salinibacterium sp.]